MVAAVAVGVTVTTGVGVGVAAGVTVGTGVAVGVGVTTGVFSGTGVMVGTIAAAKDKEDGELLLLTFLDPFMAKVAVLVILAPSARSLLTVT